MIGVNVTVVDNDHLWKRMVNNLNKLNNSYVDAGFPEGREIKSGSRKGSGRKPFTAMSQMAYVAALHEKGSEKMKARPFMGPAIDNNLQLIESKKASLIREMIANGKSSHYVNTQLGMLLRDLIKSEIKGGKFAKLEPRTIANKGSDVPLIDIKQMFNSVNYKVVSK